MGLVVVRRTQAGIGKNGKPYYASGVKPMTMSNRAMSSPARESFNGANGMMTELRALGSECS